MATTPRSSLRSSNRAPARRNCRSGRGIGERLQSLGRSFMKTPPANLRFRANPNPSDAPVAPLCGAACRCGLEVVLSRAPFKGLASHSARAVASRRRVWALPARVHNIPRAKFPSLRSLSFLRAARCGPPQDYTSAPPNPITRSDPIEPIPCRGREGVPRTRPRFGQYVPGRFASIQRTYLVFMRIKMYYLIE